MKILIWTQHFWPEIFRINEIAEALKKQDNDISVLTGKPNYPEGDIYKGYKGFKVSKELYNNIEIFRIPIIPRKKGAAINLILNYLSFIFSGFIFAPFLLRKKNFDSIFVYATSPLLQAIPAIFLSWLKDVPLTIWVQDLWPESLKETGFIKNRFLLYIVEIFVRFIYSKADIILIQSEGFRESVGRLIKDQNKIKLLFNPADIESDSENLIHPLTHQIKQKFSLVFTGNIGSVQDCETIIEAAFILKNHIDIEFYIIGMGSRFQAIYDFVKEKNLSNVIMPGKLDIKYMPDILASASALLITLKDLPNISQTIPSKLPSYFAAAKPIIASINGEVAKIVNYVNAGLVVKAETPKALADAIIKLYNMTQLEREVMGTNARNYYEANFRMEIFIEKLIEYLKN